jgi:dUTPase
MKINIINKTEFELPKYETIGSAGMDLRADLKTMDESFFEIKGKYYSENEQYEGNYKDGLWLEPHKQYIIPTGIYIALPKPIVEIKSGEGYGYEAQIRPRSGMAAKHGITVVNSPGTIDCFSYNSTIKTPDGEMNINDIRIGDIVLSVNDDNLEIEKDIVDAIVDTGVQDVFIIETEDGVLEVTSNTLIYTEKGVKMANELNLNDNILFFKMKLTKIKSIKKDTKQTYDITVRKNHNFFCNNHLIHNCDYRGEIKIILMNLSKKPFKIFHGDRIAQMVINRFERVSLVSVDSLDDTDRGEGGFGHTGLK